MKDSSAPDESQAPSPSKATASANGTTPKKKTPAKKAGKSPKTPLKGQKSISEFFSPSGEDNKNVNNQQPNNSVDDLAAEENPSMYTEQEAELDSMMEVCTFFP